MTLQRRCEIGETSAWEKDDRVSMYGRLSLAITFDRRKANMERLTTIAHNPGTREDLV